MPPVAIGHETIGFRRSPASRLVERERRGVAEHRLDDLPLGFDDVRPAKKAGVAVHRRLQEPSVGRHLVDRLPADRQLDRQQIVLLPFLPDHGSQRDEFVGIKTNTNIIMRMV